MTSPYVDDIYLIRISEGLGITGYKSMYPPLSIVSYMSDHPTQRSSATTWPPSLLAVLMTMQLVSSFHRVSSRSGSRLIACLFFLYAAWLYIHDLPGRHLENSSNVTMSSNLVVRLACYRSPRQLPSRIHTPNGPTPIPVTIKLPQARKRRSWATGAKRCKRQAYLPDYVAHITLSLCPSPLRRDKKNGYAGLNLVAFS